MTVLARASSNGYLYCPVYLYEGKSISKLQMDIELKQI
jgi:hypothetical protein